MTLLSLDDTEHATSKSLSDKEFTIFRVGIFTTLKSAKYLSISHLQVAHPGRSSDDDFLIQLHGHRAKYS